MGSYRTSILTPDGRRAVAEKLATPALILLLALAVLAAPAAAPVQAAPLPQAGTGDVQNAQAATGGAQASQGAQLFQSKCTSCHTIGKGKLVGPDLQGVTQRRDAQWLRSFIADPNKLFASNDPTAQQLLKQYNNVKMPALGLTDAEVAALLAYLGGPSPVAGGAPALAVAAGNPAVGGQIFQGALGLSGRGPACIACHTVAGTGTLGGGALGPDLTHVAQRYGEPGLAATLQTIAFPTMVGPFTNRPLSAAEQADLVAFFVQADAQQPAVAAIAPGAVTTNLWLVLGIALAGMAALFIILSVFWPRQRQSISARLRSRGR